VVRDASGVTTTGVPLLSSAWAAVANSAAASSSVEARVFRMIFSKSLDIIAQRASARKFFPFSAVILVGR
jgi:hypothetical protein